jgi:1-acyl-sn-glycerol-3-phosphate acyltransferase
MKRAFLRSTLFNLCFYTLVAIECLICLPFLLLPRRIFMAVVHGFVLSVYGLERTILNLNYEVRGLENIPKNTPFIVAAKHQSPYETMKLHLLLNDPAIILKKELLSIPLWGQYLKKSDVIAIDRSTPDTAIQSIQDGARRMQSQGRPIVIFPQGTRVGIEETSEQKPYKVGVARIQEATGLPIVPMALNAGLYWPRSGWLKSSGTVIFKFLEPIEAGMDRQSLIKKIETTLEFESEALMQEARENQRQSRNKSAWLSWPIIFSLAIVLCFGIYSHIWTITAENIKSEYPLAIKNLADANSLVTEPKISGYPGKIQMYVPQETIRNAQGSVEVTNLRVEGWVFPYTPITVQTGPLEIENFRWPQPLEFDSLSALFRINDSILTIESAQLKKETFSARVQGDVDLDQEPVPLLNLDLTLDNHQLLLEDLGVKGIIEPRMALFVSAGLSALANAEGIVNVPIVQKERTLYAGPLPILKLPDPAPTSAAGARETAVPPAPSPQSPAE